MTLSLFYMDLVTYTADSFWYQFCFCCGSLWWSVQFICTHIRPPGQWKQIIITFEGSNLFPVAYALPYPFPPPFPHTHTRTRTHTDMKCSPTNVTSCCSCTCSYKGTLWWQHCYQTFQEIWLTSSCTTSKKHTLSSSYSVYHCHLFRYKIRLKRTQRAETSSRRSTVFVVSTIRIAFFTCSFK